MNNSYGLDRVEIEEPTDTERLGIREADLVSIIEAVREIQDSKAWSTLKEKVFDSLTNTLGIQIMLEARKVQPDPSSLNRLTGQLLWAERYSDLRKLEEAYRAELSNVRKLLYGKTQE